MNIRFGEQVIDNKIVEATWAFLGMFVLLFIGLLLLLLLSGLDFVTAFSTLAGCISNVGIGFGQAAKGFSVLNTSSKWILIFAMLVGRLEMFTLFVLFLPSFWQE